MSSDHLVLAVSDDGTQRWITLLRDYSGATNVLSATAGSLEARVQFLVQTLETRPSADVTFSTRPLSEVLATGLIEDAAALPTALPGASLCVMAPKGPPFDPNLWSLAWRDWGNQLTEGNRDSRFRAPVLFEMLRDWFAKQDFRSFRPEHPRERNDAQRVSRPGFARELLVRHDWTIADVMAERPATAPA
jgi:hypothetical protein